MCGRVVFECQCAYAIFIELQLNKEEVCGLRNSALYKLRSIALDVSVRLSQLCQNDPSGPGQPSYNLGTQDSVDFEISSQHGFMLRYTAPAGQWLALR
jgi:hypothetical protein